MHVVELSVELEQAEEDVTSKPDKPDHRSESVLFMLSVYAVNLRTSHQKWSRGTKRLRAGRCHGILGTPCFGDPGSPIYRQNRDPSPIYR